MRYPAIFLNRKIWIFVFCMTAIAAFVFTWNQAFRTRGLPSSSLTDQTVGGGVVNWWDSVPDEVRANSQSQSTFSNVSRTDYSGAESCQKCHEENYADWSEHPHRWMNALATPSAVKGDFSGQATISYKSGIARFYKEQAEYRMKLQRGDVTRVYRVSQTIGSRFYQYYVGKLVSGPEPPDNPRYDIDHVLPFGYWLEEKKWVPTVHVHYISSLDEENLPFEKRSDPFGASEEMLPSFTEYFRCNKCHTTFPLGDLLVRNPESVGRHLPIELHVNSAGLIKDTHPELIGKYEESIASGDFKKLKKEIWRFEAPTHAVNLGVSCEACHLGSRAHAEGNLKRPYFFPRNRHLFVVSEEEQDFGRSHRNVNWACGRCHVGNRPQLAAGMGTWNSTEYTDAMRGSCYSELKCIDCHDPHQAIGNKWSHSPNRDDQSCLRCHQEFQSQKAREAHTHHPATSSGSRCLNCHMPRINEGMQDVVRTHTIFSPTNRSMIESNHPNACNQCHVKESISWTRGYLKKWYGVTYDEKPIADNYAEPERSVVLGWLQSQNESVRVIAVDSLARTNSNWALPQIINALDDPFLLNRQFAGRALETMTGIKLDSYGYQFYMGSDERTRPLELIRSKLLWDK